MCGIVGALTAGPLESAVIERMKSRIEHRGPDGSGTRMFECGGLGSRRLAIIDLQTGAQPLANEDGTVWVALNGEIYNYRELRAVLEGQGHVFSTSSDTEVVVHLFEEYGTGFVDHLRGMFAVAVWDSNRQRLVLARDRIGKKPLYYSSNRSGFFFGSEIPAVAEASAERTIDPSAVGLYLGFGYIPGPGTIFREIQSVPPGHLLEIGRDRVPHLRQYWRLDFSRKESKSEAAWIREVRDTVRQAVVLRLRSDVPVGVLLSGGIDSGIVTGLAAQNSTRPILSFSIGFEDAAYDELPLARLLAAKYGTRHHEHVVTSDIRTLLPRIVKSHGQPFGDSSAVPTFWVSELAAREVKVVLNGDGGDEAFGGYRRYLAAGIAARVPAILASATGAIGRRLPSATDRRSSYGFARRLVEGFGQSFAERYLTWTSLSSDATLQRLLKPELCPARTQMIQGWLDPALQDAVDQIVQTDCSHLLPDDLLVKMDIASMSCSLEARSPFLDQEVLELAARMPSSLKLKHRTTKYILREAFRDLLPARVRSEPKRGFEIPAARWLREDLRELVQDLLLSPGLRIEEYVQPPYVEQVVREHQRNEADHANLLWALMVLSLWLEMN